MVRPIVARNTAWCNPLLAHLDPLPLPGRVWVRFFVR
jgi:hypothetical protein